MDNSKDVLIQSNHTFRVNVSYLEKLPQYHENNDLKHFLKNSVTVANSIVSFLNPLKPLIKENFVNNDEFIDMLQAAHTYKDIIKLKMYQFINILQDLSNGKFQKYLKNGKINNPNLNSDLIRLMGIIENIDIKFTYDYEIYKKREQSLTYTVETILMSIFGYKYLIYCFCYLIFMLSKSQTTTKTTDDGFDFEQNMFSLINYMSFDIQKMEFFSCSVKEILQYFEISNKILLQIINNHKLDNQQKFKQITQQLIIYVDKILYVINVN